MGKKDKKGDTSDGSSVEEEYVVEKVLDKRTVKGKVRIWLFTLFVSPIFRLKRTCDFLLFCYCIALILVTVHNVSFVYLPHY